MAFSAPGRSDRVTRFGPAFRLQAAAFASFVALLGIFEFVGVPDAVLGILLIGAPLIAYVLIGIGSRTLQVQEFYVAGRRIPPLIAGMSGAAAWLGSTVLIGVVGSYFFDGPFATVSMLGALGGFLLVGVLFAPYFRKFGAFTIPDFLAARFASLPVRLAAILVLLVASVPLLAAEFLAIGHVLAGPLGLELRTATFAGLGLVLLCTLFSGIRGVIWVGAAQYFVLAASIVVTATFVALVLTGNPFAPVAIADILVQIGELEIAAGLGEAQTGAPVGDALRAITAPHSGMPGPAAAGFGQAVLLAFCLMVGAASLPHMLMHTFCASSVGDARRATGWALGLSALVLLFIPAIAIFAKFAVLDGLIGARLAALPDWVAAWRESGLVTLADADGDGIAGIGEVAFRPDFILLALPDMLAAPGILSALLLTGLLAATLSTAGGLLVAVGATLSHDIYYRMLDRNAATTRRLVAARLALLAAAAGGGWLALQPELGVATYAAFAFSFAAAGNFPALVLAIWWKRTTGLAATLGMLTGLATTLLYIGHSIVSGAPAVPGLPASAAAVIGLPVGVLMIVAISLASRRPDTARLAFIDEIRTPRGSSLMERERAAERIREAGKGARSE